MRIYNINNERGGMAALLSVVVLSLIMVTTLTSFYTYLENRARFQERIRVNYQMGYVVEDMSRVLVEAREQFLADSTCTTFPNTAPRYVDCTEVCALTTVGLSVPAGTPPNALCVKNDSLNKIVNNADYFCTFNTEGSFGATAPPYCGALAASLDSDDIGGATTAVAVNERSKMENWYSRLDNFFDTTIVKNAPVLAGKMYPVLEAKIQPPTLLGWLLPETAMANAGGPPPGYPPPYEPPPGEDPPITGGGGPITQPGPTQPAPPHVAECESDAELDGCSSHCEDRPGETKPAFCKNAGARISVGLVDGTGCTAASTDPRCKRCGRVERLTGGCVKMSVCPPWVPAAECNPTAGGAGSDKKIHQMVKLADLNLATFMWGVGPWGACAAGSRTRSVDCLDMATLAVVAPGNCVAATPPSDTQSPCFGGVGGGCQTHFCNPVTSMCHWVDCP